jgi:hypothetical protein
MVAVKDIASDHSDLCAGKDRRAGANDFVEIRPIGGGLFFFGGKKRSEERKVKWFAFHLITRRPSGCSDWIFVVPVRLEPQHVKLPTLRWTDSVFHLLWKTRTVMNPSGEKQSRTRRRKIDAILRISVGEYFGFRHFRELSSHRFGVGNLGRMLHLFHRDTPFPRHGIHQADQGRTPTRQALCERLDEVTSLIRQQRS